MGRMITENVDDRRYRDPLGRYTLFWSKGEGGLSILASRTQKRQRCIHKDESGC